MKAPKAIFVSYCPKDIYEGTELMPALDELAYRRLIDLIYMTGDRVPDDGEALARSTKTAERWPEIRRRLIDSGKIRVVHGRLTNERCQKELAKVGAKIDKNRRAGVASAESRKSLKERDNPTDVATDVATNVPTYGQPNHLTTEPLNQEEVPTERPFLFGESEKRNLSDSVESDFSIWWEHVPNKKAKDGALTCYRRARKRATAQALLAGIQRYAASVAGKDRKYIAHPTTWLNEGRWKDEDASDQGQTVIDISAAARARIAARWGGGAQANG